MRSRGHTRVSVHREIECVVEGDRRFAEIYDLSIGGCMLEVAGPVSVGCRVSVNLVDIDRASGTIVWIHGRNIGIRFEHDLHPAIVAHLGFVPSSLKFDEIEPRDRFGRRLPELRPGSF